MIISNSRRFIFVHIHKTAGEAITESLAPHLAWNDVVLGCTKLGEAVDPHFKAQFGLQKHSDARRIRDVVGDAVWRDYFTFSIVRHPADRIRSLYGYLGRIAAEKRGSGLRRRLAYMRRDATRAPWSWPGMQAYLETEDFSAFIRDPQFETAPAAQSQAAMLTDDAGQVMVDHVARFEDLAAAFAVIAARIGAPEARLGHKNASRAAGAGGKAAMTPADRAYLCDRYAEDIALFGYAEAEAVP